MNDLTRLSTHQSHAVMLYEGVRAVRLFNKS